MIMSENDKLHSIDVHDIQCSIGDGILGKGSLAPTPRIALDIIGRRAGHKDEVLLIERVNTPYGWALPGGAMDVGEYAVDGALRELEEETSMLGRAPTLFHVYSNPSRDPRGHVVSIVYTCEVTGTPRAQSDAKKVQFFSLFDLPTLAFDHKTILDDYTNRVQGWGGCGTRR